MTAYNREWLDAILTRDTAGEWHKKGLLSDEKWQGIQERFTTHFYSPNIFVRIGLAIFSLILIMAAMGLAALITEPNSEFGLTGFCVFWGIICIAVLESWSIRTARHHSSGIDDMLLYVGLCTILGGFFTPLHYSTPTLVYCCIAWPFLVAGSIRYLDRLLAAAAFVCSLLIVLLVVKEIPRLALYLLPFAGMVFSAGMYLFSRNGQNRYIWRHWHGVLLVVEMLSLASFYASGNYWVVQQAGFDIFGLEQVPMAGFFWLFTFAVPAGYIYYGLYRKDRHMLDTGLGCIAAAVFTFRYYFHVIPLAWAGVIGGAVLFATAYFSIRYLRKNDGVYTYDQDTEASMLQEIEEQLIEQTIVNQPGSNPEKKDAFGGGQFGGGGASGEF